MKLLNELLIVGAEVEVRSKFNDVLLEDANKHVLSAVASLKAGKPIEQDTLAKLITGIKVISKNEYRSALTKDDVGINPNNAKELLDLLNSVSHDPKMKLTGSAAKFFTAVSSLSRSLLEKTEKLVKDAAAGSDDAIKELSMFAQKMDAMVTRLRGAVKA